MTIFQYINSILFSKKKIDINCDDESQFNLFMLNRWTSMYSKELNEYINETSNKFWSVFNEKTEQYSYLNNVIPKLRYARINYIKKAKKEKLKNEEEPIIPEFYSKREYKQLVDISKSISK